MSYPKGPCDNLEAKNDRKRYLEKDTWESVRKKLGTLYLEKDVWEPVRVE